MGTGIIGAAPRQIILVGICSDPECSEYGVPVQVSPGEDTYTCSCGQVVSTFQYNKEAHEAFQKMYEDDLDERINSTVRWSYAPQLNLDKDGGEPVS